MKSNRFILFFQVFHPSVVLAVLEIVVVSLMLVSLSFKAYAQVGIAFWEKTYEPFYKVDEIEWQVGKFPHLSCVNAFMVDKPFA